MRGFRGRRRGGFGGFYPPPPPAPKMEKKEEKDKKVEEDNVDVLDVLIEGAKKTTKKIVSSTIPPIIRPSIEVSTKTEVDRRRDLLEEMKVVEEKVSEASVERDTLKTQYSSLMKTVIAKKSGLTVNLWHEVIQYVDRFTAVRLALTNSFFQEVIMENEEYWERMFVLTFISGAKDVKERKAQLMASTGKKTYFEATKFLLCNQEALSMTVVSTTGGEQFGFSSQNLVSATYTQQHNNLNYNQSDQVRSGYRTKTGNTNNVNVLLKCIENTPLCFSCEIIVPRQFRYNTQVANNTVDNVMVWVSDSEFKKDVVEKINSKYDHIMQMEDMEEAQKKSPQSKDGVPDPTFVYFGISDVCKEREEEKRTVTKKLACPIPCKFVLLKLISSTVGGAKDEKKAPNSIDIDGFNLTGVKQL